MIDRIISHHNVWTSLQLLHAKFNELNGFLQPKKISSLILILEWKLETLLSAKLFFQASKRFLDCCSQTCWQHSPYGCPSHKLDLHFTQTHNPVSFRVQHPMLHASRSVATGLVKYLSTVNTLFQHNIFALEDPNVYHLHESCTTK